MVVRCGSADRGDHSKKGNEQLQWHSRQSIRGRSCHRCVFARPLSLRPLSGGRGPLLSSNGQRSAPVGEQSQRSSVSLVAGRVASLRCSCEAPLERTAVRGPRVECARVELGGGRGRRFRLVLEQQPRRRLHTAAIDSIAAVTVTPLDDTRCALLPPALRLTQRPVKRVV